MSTTKQDNKMEPGLNHPTRYALINTHLGQTELFQRGGPVIFAPDEERRRRQPAEEKWRPKTKDLMLLRQFVLDGTRADEVFFPFLLLPMRLLDGREPRAAGRWLLERQHRARAEYLAVLDRTLEARVSNTRWRLLRAREAMIKQLQEDVALDVEAAELADRRGSPVDAAVAARDPAAAERSLRDEMARDARLVEPSGAAAKLSRAAIQAAHEIRRDAGRVLTTLAHGRAEARRRHVDWLRRTKDRERHDDETQRVLFEEHHALVRFYHRVIDLHPPARGQHRFEFEAEDGTPRVMWVEPGGPPPPRGEAPDAAAPEPEVRPEPAATFADVERHVREGRPGPIPTLECAICRLPLALRTSVLPLERPAGEAGTPEDYGVILECGHVFGRRCLADCLGDRATAQCKLCRQKYEPGELDSTFVAQKFFEKCLLGME